METSFLRRFETHRSEASTRHKATLRFGAVALVLAVAASIGCGPPEAERASVKGKVSYQGNPIADGSITFFPSGATKGKPAGTEIVNGEYTLSAADGPLVGEARVEIQAFEKTGRKIPDLMGDVSNPNRPLIDEKINVLPPQFNVNSTLMRQITSGENSHDFDL